MIIAIDFDGTIVEQDRAYADLDTPLVLLHGAREGLQALRRAGHMLLLWSARANRAMRLDPTLDPLARAGVRKLDRARWERERPVHEARYQQMLDFVAKELPGIFAAVDDGAQGKPDCDLFIDDKAIRYGYGYGALAWPALAAAWGEGPMGSDPRATIEAMA